MRSEQVPQRTIGVFGELNEDLKRRFAYGVEYEDVQSLVATSWAVFLSLKDDRLESRYRLRAFDWDNLLERLKLAQYALREKELLLQGQLMLLETSPQNDDGPIATADFLDAFQ